MNDKVGKIENPKYETQSMKNRMNEMLKRSIYTCIMLQRNQNQQQSHMRMAENDNGQQTDTHFADHLYQISFDENLKVFSAINLRRNSIGIWLKGIENDG